MEMEAFFMAITTQDIEQVLERDIRPILASHHGNVVLQDFADGKVYIRLTGMCSGCPSATITTEEIVAERLKAVFPEIEDVILDTSVSDDLIAQAKAILSQHHV
jgi:Fe-S cluster biogenesis protein NfuA